MIFSGAGDVAEDASTAADAGGGVGCVAVAGAGGVGMVAATRCG